MAGLIKTEIDKENPLSSVSTYEAERIEVDPSKDTVAGQVDSIIDKDSPLMQSAATKGTQFAAKRGLLNSSMAAQSSQQAVLDTALPMAQQDAATYFAAKGRNQDAGNRALEFGAGAANQAESQHLAGQIETDLIAQRGQIEKELQSADAATRERLLAQQGEIDMQLQELRGEQTTKLAELNHQFNVELQKLSGDQQIQLQKLQGKQAKQIARIEAENKALLQANASAAQIFSTTQLAIGEILANPDIPIDQKQTLVNNHLQLLENGMAVVGGVANIDLTGLLEFPEPTAPGTPTGGGGRTPTIKTGGGTFTPGGFDDGRGTFTWG